MRDSVMPISLSEPQVRVIPKILEGYQIARIKDYIKDGLELIERMGFTDEDGSRMVFGIRHFSVSERKIDFDIGEGKTIPATITSIWYHPCGEKPANHDRSVLDVVYTGSYTRQDFLDIDFTDDPRWQQKFAAIINEKQTIFSAYQDDLNRQRQVIAERQANDAAIVAEAKRSGEEWQASMAKRHKAPQEGQYPRPQLWTDNQAQTA